MDSRTTPHSSQPRRRKRGSRLAALAGTAVVLGLVVAAVGLAPGLINRLVLPPAPVAQELDDNSSLEALAARREGAAAQLSSYGWLISEAGIARIPIDRAMALLVDQGLPVGAPQPAATEAATDSAPVTAIDPAGVSFQADVLPIFIDRCSECHGEDDPEEGLQLTSYNSVMAGSFYGAVVKAGDVGGSYLAEMITTGQMPKRGDPLTPVQVETILAWITAGAMDN